MSYLVAGSVRNHVHHRHILHASGILGEPSSIPFRSPNDLASLRSFLDVEGDRYDRLFFPPETSGGKVPTVVFNGVPIRRSFIDTSRRRISPASLRASDHGRARWLIAPLTYCPVSWELLTDVCLNPECGAPLGWHKLEHFSQCPRCKSDLRDYDGHLVDEHLHARLSILADLIAEDEENRERALMSFPAEIQALGNGGLFDLAVTLSRHGQERWEPEEECRLARAVSALQGWPAKFVDFRYHADAIAIRNRQPTFSERFVASLRSDSALPAVQSFFASDLVKTMGCDIDQREAVQKELLASGYYTITDAAKFIGTSMANVEALFAAGLLEGRRVSIRGSERIWIDRPSARAAKSEVDGRITLTMLSRLSGLSRLSLRTLIAAGLLTELRSAILDVCFDEEQVDAGSARRFLAKLTDATVELPNNGIGWCSLESAMRHIGGRPKPVVALMNYLADRPGILAAPRKADGRFDLSRVHIRLDAMEALAALPSSFDDVAWDQIIHVCLHDAADILNCNWVGIQTLREQNIIPENSVSNNLIARQAIQAAAENVISSNEIAARMSSHFGTVDQFLAAFKVEPVCAGFMRRDEVEPHLGNVQAGWAAERMDMLRLNYEEIDSGRADLTDAEWNRVRAWIPRRRFDSLYVDDRNAINAHIWAICLRRRIQMAPERYGSNDTITRRISLLKRGGYMSRIEEIISRAMRAAA